MQRRESLLISSKYPQSCKLQKEPLRQRPTLQLEKTAKKGSPSDSEFQGKEKRERMSSR